MFIFEFNKISVLNYLAHIFLSGNQPGIMTGNFIGDFVKGNKYNQYPPHIRNGIILHRKIDAFTDSHEDFKSIVKILQPEFGRYSAIIADMYIDHLLAIHFKQYAGNSLFIFSMKFNVIVLCNYFFLPKRVKRFIFHFTGTNRLYKYKTPKGLQESLQIMANYKIPQLNPDKSITFLKSNLKLIEPFFHLLMQDIINFAKNERMILLYQ
jgi:acyl carrier protein phosphodiesterase